MHHTQTELGHGSNIRGLQTTATYDAATEEFVLNTNTLQGTKWYVVRGTWYDTSARNV